MFAQSGDAVIVGDADGGWFWLSPMALWAPWASEALARALGLSPKKRFLLTGHWKRGVLEVQSQ